MYIKDLLSDNCNILSHQEINEKYNVRCNFFNILQLLRQIIPFVWTGYSCYRRKEYITLTDQNGNVLDIRNVNFKTIYWIFVYQKIKTAIKY